MKQEVDLIYRKRPRILTAICIKGITWSLLNFVFVFSPFIRRISDIAPAVYGIIIAMQFISFIGIWHMKKWGVHLFIVSFFSQLLFALSVDDVSIVGIVLRGIYLIFFLFYYRRMEDEL